MSEEDISTADLDDRLRRFAADRHRQQKLTHDLRQIDGQLQQHELVRQRWQETVESSSDDLRRLEGLTLAGLFWRVRAKIDSALDKVTAALDRTRELVWAMERRARSTTALLEQARTERATWI